MVDETLRQLRDGGFTPQSYDAAGPDPTRSRWWSRRQEPEPRRLWFDVIQPEPYEGSRGLTTPGARLVLFLDGSLHDNHVASSPVPARDYPVASDEQLDVLVNALRALGRTGKPTIELNPSGLYVHPTTPT